MTLDLDGNPAPTQADVRKLQRLAARLRKRYLSPKHNSIEFATREGVSFANACRWTKPSFPDNSASVATWARGWMSAYQHRFDEVLAACADGRFG